MTDTAVTPPSTPDEQILDSAPPRLGSTPMAPPAPLASTGTPIAPTLPDAAPTLPVVSPVLTAPESSPAPGDDEERFAPAALLGDVHVPTLPDSAPAAPARVAEMTTAETDTESEPASDHPMAHLMPAKSKPTEASLRAAEQRAIKKAKAKSTLR